MAIKDVILGYAKGEKGDPGPRGEKGNTGATGPKGDPGNIADAQITDTEGLDVAKGQKTTAQKLFDAIANRIVTKLVTNDALTKKLADYMLKGMMSNTNVNNTGTVPTSALMYSMFEQINNNLYKVNVVKGSLLDYAKSVNAFENVNIGDPTTDVPDSARYCMAHIMNRANSWFISIEGRDNRLYTNYNNGNDWTGWHSTALKSDLTDYIRYENVPITIPASAVYVDVPLSYTCNYVRSAVSINGSGIIIIQAARAESKKVRLYVVEKEIERQTTVCIGYSL